MDKNIDEENIDEMLQAGDVDRRKRSMKVMMDIQDCVQVNLLKIHRILTEHSISHIS